MSGEEDDDIPSNEYWDKGVIFVAALLTLCAIGVCFFEFTIKPAKAPIPARPAATSGEVTVGISPSKPATSP
ncbi:MAG: hypothetical protein ACXWLD_00495 [Rhizomicrobium sp.]|jgi:hypothetical protein